MSFLRKTHVVPTTLLFALLPTVANAATIQNQNCTIQGDSDVYGPGIRYGLYFQWAATVLFLFFCPERVNIARSSSAILTLAVYINFFRNVRDGHLVSIEWLLLFNIFTALLLGSCPTTINSWRKGGGTVALVFLIFAAYYLGTPYVLFRSWTNGLQPNCDIKDFLFVPVSVYSHGWLTTFKVLFVIAAVIAVPSLVVGAISALYYWFTGWFHDGLESTYEPMNFASASQGFSSMLLGVVAIPFAEKMLKINHVEFPGVTITTSGQLIPLLVGAFTLYSAVINSIKAILSKVKSE
jgi:hypothetical protein